MDDPGCIQGTVTTRQCQPAPATRTALKEAGRAKFVYDFAEGNKDLKDLLGGKGANLAEMTNLGLPVPPGFTITTDACRAYLAHRRAAGGLATRSTRTCALEDGDGPPARRPGRPAAGVGPVGREVLHARA